MCSFAIELGNRAGIASDSSSPGYRSRPRSNEGACPDHGLTAEVQRPVFIFKASTGGRSRAKHLGRSSPTVLARCPGLSGSLRVASAVLQLVLFAILVWLAADREAHERWHAWEAGVSPGCHCGHGHGDDETSSDPGPPDDRADCVINLLAHGKAWSSLVPSFVVAAHAGVVQMTHRASLPFYSRTSCVLPYGCGPPFASTEAMS